MSAKIPLSVLVAFIISFSVLSLSLFLYHYQLYGEKWILKANDELTVQKNFYSQNFPLNQKKIFILGSSQIQALNPNYIQEELLKNNLNYTVYNLSIGGDLPKLRLQTVDWIVSAKPAMVVYGISDRDFRISFGSLSSSQNQVNLLPNPHDLMDDWIHTQLQNSKFDFYILESPKFDFLTSVFGSNYTKANILHVFIPNPTAHSNFLENGNWTTANDTTLEIQGGNSFYGTIKELPLEKNENLISFKKTIGELHKNKIPVVIFVVPQERHRLDQVKNVEEFNLVLKNISQGYPDVPIYSLWDRYADLHIWQDVEHVIMNSKKTTRIYSDDIAKIITTELHNLSSPSSSRNTTIQLVASGNN